jgi:dsDNA-specific endonuclease/ATPase MutS2
VEHDLYASVYLEVPLLHCDQVLADVGDGQSLQQSLSTFSAHVRRLRLMLGSVMPQSLALLDEVGSGAVLHCVT